MGEKNKRKDLICCIYCGFKGEKSDLEEREYIYETKIGSVFECPRCGMQQKSEK